MTEASENNTKAMMKSLNQHIEKAEKDLPKLIAFFAKETDGNMFTAICTTMMFSVGISKQLEMPESVFNQLINLFLKKTEVVSFSDEEKKELRDQAEVDMLEILGSKLHPDFGKLTELAFQKLLKQKAEEADAKASKKEEVPEAKQMDFPAKFSKEDVKNLEKITAEIPVILKENETFEELAAHAYHAYIQERSCRTEDFGKDFGKEFPAWSNLSEPRKAAWIETIKSIRIRQGFEKMMEEEYTKIRQQKGDARTFPDGRKVPDNFPDRPGEEPSQFNYAKTNNLLLNGFKVFRKKWAEDNDDVMYLTTSQKLPLQIIAVNFNDRPFNYTITKEDINATDWEIYQEHDGSGQESNPAD